MKLGRLLSVGEVVEDSVPEELTRATPAPDSTTAEGVTERPDRSPAVPADVIAAER